MKRVLVLMLAILCLSASLSGAVFAQNVNPTPPLYITFVPNLLGCPDIGCVVGKILDTLALLAAPFVAIMVLVGAFQIITAAGDPEKFKSGRTTILYAVVGYAIVLLASSVVPIIKGLLGTP